MGFLGFHPPFWGSPPYMYAKYQGFKQTLNFTEGLIIVVEILSEVRHGAFIQLP